MANVTRRPATLKTVAQAADVSIQTVSAIINGKPGHTDETRARVLKAVQQLGYRPYTIARSLRTGQTQTIALLVHDVSNPFFAAIAGTAEDHARTSGYSMILYNTHDDVEREASYIRSAIESWVDGVLFVSTKDHMNSIKALQAAGIPSVAIERIPEEYDGPSVTMNNATAGRMAAEHLLNLAHTHIAHISGPLWLRSSRERLAGFRQTIEAHGYTLPEDACPEGNWGCDSGYHAMQCLLARVPRPTAVFAGNDRMAIGARLAADQARLRVPADVSIIGLDDIEVAAYQTPPLTTIRQSSVELATKGVHLLLDILARKEIEQPQVMIEPILIERQSTAPLLHS